MQRLTTRLVPPDGPLDAKICFIGEAPGADEDIKIKPFVGAAGQFFNRCITQVGLPRKTVLVTNVFMQRPPKNNAGYYYQDNKRRVLTWEGEEHIEHLRVWLEGLNPRPNILVALGDTAMKHLTGKSGITKHRGSIYPCTLVPGYKVYCTYHPSFVMRLINEPIEALPGEKKRQQQNAYALFTIDLQRILEQSESPELIYPKRTFDVSLSFLELCEKLKSMRSQKLIAVDIETIPTEYGPVLWCIGFSPKPDYAFTVPILRRTIPAWPVEQEAELWILISEIFLDKKITKVFQGGLYDLSILGRYYGIRCAVGTYADTMFCHHATYLCIPKALHVQTSIYTWEPYYKDEGRINFGARTDEAEFIYNCKDCCVTREIYPVVSREAREAGTYDGYKRTISIMPSLLGMMIRGVKINLEKKAILSEEFRKKSLKYQSLLAQETGEDWNPQSPKEIRKLLYGVYGLPTQEDPKTGRSTVNQDALRKLKKKFPQLKAIDYILGCRKFTKLASTYADMKVDEDGRIHTSYGVVSTWRLSSSESPFGSGGNLQNIPVRSEEGKLIRALFIPDEGKVLLASDLSQAEARVVAWEAGDQRQIDLFSKGWDVHWANTQLLFNLGSSNFEPNRLYEDPISGQELTFKQLRHIGKTVIHAGNYGMGWMKLQAILIASGFHFEAKVCKTLMDRHRANNPFISAWQQAIRDQVRSKRYLISSFDRKRDFLGRLNDNLYRSAYAFSPQNTVGELLQVAIQNIWTDLDYIDILLNVHDEVVCQLSLGDVPRALKDIKAKMEIPIRVPDRVMTTITRDLTIPCDFKIGWNWGEMTEDIHTFLDAQAFERWGS